MNNDTEKISIYHNGMFCHKAACIMYTTSRGRGRGKNLRGQEKNFWGRKRGRNFKVICKLVLISYLQASIKQLLDEVFVTSGITVKVRDGPLENLWGGRAKYKKKIRAREN